MGARWLALLALVSGVVSAALGLAGLVVVVVTGGSAGALGVGFLAASVGFAGLALVSVLLEIVGVFKGDGDGGRRRAG